MFFVYIIYPSFRINDIILCKLIWHSGRHYRCSSLVLTSTCFIDPLDCTYFIEIPHNRKIWNKNRQSCSEKIMWLVCTQSVIIITSLIRLITVMTQFRCLYEMLLLWNSKMNKWLLCIAKWVLCQLYHCANERHSMKWWCCPLYTTEF